MPINEEKLMSMFEAKAKVFEKEYEDVLNQIAKSDIFTKTGRPLNKLDVYNIGTMIETYKQYEAFVRETASASDLGSLPNIAVDLIAATYAVSVAPLLASMQTLGEQQGIVYFKQVKTSNTRADRTVGDVWVDPKEGIKNGLDNYASELIENEKIGTTANATHQDFAAVAIPIRSNIPITVICPGVTNAEGVFMNGVLMSAFGVWTGDINYTSGDINIDFASAPAAGHDVFMTYHQDMEKASDIPTIDSSLQSTDVMAEVLALKQTIGTLKSFQFSRRFGKIAEDDALMDLAGAMADVESRKIIKGYSQMADWVEVNYPNNTLEFSRTTPATLSEFEYRQGFRYRLAEADSAINLNCGRGAANRYVAGHRACEFISSLPKFVAAATNLAVGPHVFGYLDGKPVIRTIYVDNDTIVCSYLNPTSPFEAPSVCGTYMPVFITNTMQMGTNPLQNMRAIASWKAFKNCVPQMVKKIRLIP